MREPDDAVPAPRRPRRRGAVALCLATALTLTACGGPSDQQQVRTTLQRFGRAVARRDYRTVCAALLAPGLVERLAEIGLPCETALARGFGRARQPTLAVRSVRVTGASATALVHSGAANQAPSDDTVGLAKVRGSWRISSLGTATATRSAKPLPSKPAPAAPAAPARHATPLKRKAPAKRR